MFPVLHGLYGEDGTVQGLFELARLPYVGCGVLASAVSMDKLYTKIIVDDLGVRQADYVPVMRRELSCMETVVKRVEAKILLSCIYQAVQCRIIQRRVQGFLQGRA